MVERFSKINLVDLAGSERAKDTGTTGKKFKEGCNINLSLTVLGRVISTLADISTGKVKKTTRVPYRESALTRILQNGLGGNSKTVMICALSPASTNYKESLETLKYAERMKKVKNVAIVNESEQDKQIRALKEENLKLRSLLSEGGFHNFDNPEIMNSLLQLGIEVKEPEEIKEQLEDNEKEVKNLEMNWDQKLQEEEELGQEG